MKSYPKVILVEGQAGLLPQSYVWRECSAGSLVSKEFSLPIAIGMQPEFNALQFISTHQKNNNKIYLSKYFVVSN